MHEVFDKKLHLIMVNYRENHCWLQAEDKFEFLNCCLQYEKYLIFGEQYRTQFTIYFDATCSGSQLITLLLGVDEYVKDLNLAATSEMDELKDYYLRIVNDYKKLLLDELKNNDTLKNELLEKLKTN
jgi:DNA-directed RNA polymerase